jgi:hypothetical protein
MFVAKCTICIVPPSHSQQMKINFYLPHSSEKITRDERDFSLPILSCNVADTWQFGVDPDPDPRIHASD